MFIVLLNISDTLALCSLALSEVCRHECWDIDGETSKRGAKIGSFRHSIDTLVAAGTCLHN